MTQLCLPLWIPKRWEFVAGYGSQVIGGVVVRDDTGPHCIDLNWPWWTPR